MTNTEPKTSFPGAGHSFALLLFSVAYPIVRYNVFGGVSWDHLPMFVLNKSFCLYTTFALFYTALALRRPHPAGQIYWWDRTLWSAAAHILVSLVISGGDYYAKIHGSDGKMTLFGELSMLAGVLATFVYWTNYCNASCLRIRKLPLTLGAWMLAVHLLFIGFKGWFTVSKWYGGMPPITLICFVVSVAAAVLLAFPAKPSRDNP